MGKKTNDRLLIARATATLQLPEWVGDFLGPRELVYSGPAERMRLAIDLSRANVQFGTGGPFGAAVFERDSGKLVAVGVNIVVSSAVSLAHAEMVALSLAQARLETFDLGSTDLPDHELVTSCEPCAMCFGAVPWSGVRRLVCGAREEDARSIGFEEGRKLKNWDDALRESSTRS